MALQDHVHFVKVAVSVTIRAPERANRHLGQRMQVAGRSAAGTLFVYDKGVSLGRLALDFTELSADDKNDLDAFFHTTVQAQMQTFTYTDHWNAAWTARFCQTELQWTEQDNGCWAVSFELEVTPA